MQDAVCVYIYIEPLLKLLKCNWSICSLSEISERFLASCTHKAY